MFNFARYAVQILEEYSFPNRSPLCRGPEQPPDSSLLWCGGATLGGRTGSNSARLSVIVPVYVTPHRFIVLIR
jgi:hypothetical protein